jgi:plastocyanin
MPSTSKSILNRVVALLGAALILAAGVVAMTSRGGDGAAASPRVATADVDVDHVDIKDFKFAPVAISVKVGTTITWTNTDNAPHTATSGASPMPDGVFDTDIIAKGHSKTIKAAKRGTFEYYCALHPFMHATVTVR